MGYTGLSERDRGDIRARGKRRDRGHHTRVVTQKHRLPTHIHRMLLDHLRVPYRRGARERAGEVREEGDHAPRAVEVDLVRGGARHVGQAREVPDAAPVDAAEGLADDEEEGVALDVDAVYSNSYSSDRASTSMGHTDLGVREGGAACGPR